MKKRGQITIFIIIGFLLIIASALFFFVKQKSARFIPEEIVPDEVVPVKRFVEKCMNDVARDGIDLLGSNGGFIDIPYFISRDPKAYITVSPLFPELKTPLWYYSGYNRMPSLDYIREQLERYVGSSLQSCISNFQDFSDEFDIEEISAPQASVVFGEEDTSIELAYQLRIRDKQSTEATNMQAFITHVPKRVRTAYELASEIMESENDRMFLERRTIDWISAGPEDTIPYTSMELSCRRKTWRTLDVKNAIQERISANIPAVKVNRTLFIPPTDPYEVNHYVWHATQKEYDMHVGLTYDPAWGMDFYVRPNDRTLLKSNAQRHQDLLRFLCINIWHFTYDIRYSVLFTVIDDETVDHEAFSFSFATDVLVDHNAPDRSSFGTGLFDFESEDETATYCSDARENDLIVYTTDAVTYEDVDKVNISYTCFNRRCELGKTAFDIYGNTPSLTVKAPYCFNGILRAEKQGYEPAQLFISTDSDQDLSLYLKPVKEFLNYTVDKYRKTELDAGMEIMRKLRPEESALITITKPGTDFETRGFYTRNEENTERITLYNHVDETYHVQVLVLKGETMLGGWEGNWTVSEQEIEDAERIVFHTIVQDPPADDLEQAEFILLLEDYSGLVQEPELI